MTINHVFLAVSHKRFAAMRQFYGTVLQPIRYEQMMHPREDLVAFGSDYPYLWLKKLDEGQRPLPTHVALDAPDNAAVSEFWTKAV